MSDPKPFEAVRDYGQQHMGWPEVPDEPAPIDHKAEAEVWLAAAHRPDLSTAQTDMFSGLAQAHATLYLAEQQRIANLIAWQASDGESFRGQIRKALS